MKKIKSPFITIARKLRRMETDTEKYLWRLLRAKQFRGLKFRRQVPIGPYIVDFFVMRKRLSSNVMEDNTQMKYNKIRIETGGYSIKDFKF